MDGVLVVIVFAPLPCRESAPKGSREQAAQTLTTMAIVSIIY